MNIIETNALFDMLQTQLSSIFCQSVPAIPVDANMVIAVREGIAKVSQQIAEINPAISNRLVDLSAVLFRETICQQPNAIPYRQFFASPVIYGQIVEALAFAKVTVNQASCGSLCHLLHPDIRRVSEKLYKDGSYAEAACNAFIEINSRLKKIYCKRKPNTENIPDGQALMNKIFADNDPVLVAGDMTTKTGQDIQMGTRFLFAGAMSALRNPKSHDNFTIEKNDAMRQLIFASMLMYKVDEIL